MKKLVLIAMAMLLLSGCAAMPGAGGDLAAGDFPTEEGQQGASQCLSILMQLWERYTAQDRFSVYGGSARQPVYGRPGVIPPESSRIGAQQVDGAAVTHLFCKDIFRAAVLSVPQGQEGQAWARQLLQSVSGRSTHRYFMAAEVVPGYLALAWGDKEKVKLFEKTVTELFGSARLYCSGALPRERKTPKAG